MRNERGELSIRRPEEVMMGKFDTSLRQQPGLEQRLSQRLMMSPQMQQALQCLQLPVLELSQVISQELEQNPLLEFDEEDLIQLPMYRTLAKKQGALLENLLADTPTLRDVLIQQLSEHCKKEEEQRLGRYIIDSLNESGILEIDPAEVALLTGVSVAQVLKVLAKVQLMEPAGVGARSIRESLLLQLKRKNKQETLAYTILEKYYEDFLHNRLNLISKKTHVSVKAIAQEIKEEISGLDLHPGLNYQKHHRNEIIPDVIVTSEDGIFRVEVTDFYSDRLHLNKAYMELFQDPQIPIETKHYIKERLQSIKWLMKNIGQRNSTLEKITNQLIEINRDYFSYSDGRLVPLTMKQLADALELHESTVARAVSNKFLFCDRGTFPFKFFFSKGYKTARGELLSSKTIQDKIKKLIGEEDASSPLSDEELSQLLKQQGITCARRTVAKYRDVMGIGSTKYR